MASANNIIGTDQKEINEQEPGKALQLKIRQKNYSFVRQLKFSFSNSYSYDEMFAANKCFSFVPIGTLSRNDLIFRKFVCKAIERDWKEEWIVAFSPVLQGKSSIFGFCNLCVVSVNLCKCVLYEYKYSVWIVWMKFDKIHWTSV